MKHKNFTHEHKCHALHVIMFLLYPIDEDMSVETVQHALSLWR